ncbi:siderophore-interacting protein [Achromobacter dolens]|uniref:siderophore-interacting protein n=1 Tax=Achromobacter dolens TaxID=1287738 RepID=UPI003556A57E
MTNSSQGRMSRAFTRLFMKPTRIMAAESLAGGLRLLTLQSPAFREARWVPGQKVQIAMGSAFVARTYTPMDWDAATGRTRIVAYSHGGGPGSAWAERVEPGEACDVFGPRASLNLDRPVGACVLLGDETSIGVACALQRAMGGEARCLLEVNEAAAVRDALARLGLDAVELFGRQAGDAHLDAIEHRLPPLAAAGAAFILTGRASTIQRLRQALKALGVASERIMAKAYWAPGKTGLD